MPYIVGVGGVVLLLFFLLIYSAGYSEGQKRGYKIGEEEAYRIRH